MLGPTIQMVMAWHGRGMAFVNQILLQCVNQMEKT
jgi:hypothetical protein